VVLQVMAASLSFLQQNERIGSSENCVLKSRCYLLATTETNRKCIYKNINTGKLKT
jgi:hypothetical protein